MKPVFLLISASFRAITTKKQTDQTIDMTVKNVKVLTGPRNSLQSPAFATKAPSSPAAPSYFPSDPSPAYELRLTIHRGGSMLTVRPQPVGLISVPLVGRTLVSLHGHSCSGSSIYLSERNHYLHCICTQSLGMGIVSDSSSACLRCGGRDLPSV